jgi:Flp pilus assembly protein TadB
MRVAWLAVVAGWLLGIVLYAYGEAGAWAVAVGGLPALCLALAVWVHARRRAKATGEQPPSLTEAVIGSF